MSLIGASKTITNPTMRSRVEAAIRQTAAEKPDDGSAGAQLARQALIDPGSVAPHFLSRLAVNPAVTAASCEDCGYAAIEDGDILYVVVQEWDEVASIVFPTTA